MRLWSWVNPKRSSVGSATTVANRVIKLQSVGIAVKHHTPNEDHHISKQLQHNISPEKANKKFSFRISKVPLVFYRVL